MITELTAIVNVAKDLVQFLKDSKELISDGNQKEILTQRIQSAENSLALAESSTAKDLGYDLCKCTFPPQIMLYDNSSTNNVCPSCGNTTMAKTRIFFSN